MKTCTEIKNRKTGFRLKKTHTRSLCENKPTKGMCVLEMSLTTTIKSTDPTEKNNSKTKSNESE